MSSSNPNTIYSVNKPFWNYAPLLIIVLAGVSIYSWYFNGYVLPTSTVEGWPTIKPITAGCFILLCFANILSRKWADALTLLNITLQVCQLTLHLTDYSSETKWLTLSSPGTSIMLIIANFETLLSKRGQRFLNLATMSNLILFLVSNSVLFIYLEDPAHLSDVPGFATFSWNSAFLFLLYATFAVYRLLDERFTRLLVQLKPLGIEKLEQNLTYYIIAFPVALMSLLTFLVWYGVYNARPIFILALLVNCCIPFFVSFFVSRSYLKWLSMLAANQSTMKAFSDKLISQNQILSDLTQFISHNLRGPAVSLVTMFDNIKADFPKKSEHATGLKHFDYNLEYLNTTVSELGQLLNFIRSDINDLTFAPLKSSIEKALEINRNQYDTPFEVVIDDSSNVNIAFPEKLMFTLFDDLISNSIKFRKNKTPLKINFSIDITSDGEIRITYTDNGRGLNIERHSNMLFKPGKQFHKVSTPSSGLGMYRMRVIVERLRGSIDIQSKPDEGLTLFITMPIQNKSQS